MMQNQDLNLGYNEALLLDIAKQCYVFPRIRCCLS